MQEVRANKKRKHEKIGSTEVQGRFYEGSGFRYRSWWFEKSVYPLVSFHRLFASKSSLELFFISYFDREGDLAQR